MNIGLTGIRNYNKLFLSSCSMDGNILDCRQNYLDGLNDDKGIDKDKCGTEG